MEQYNQLVLEMDEYINEGQRFLLTVVKQEPIECHTCEKTPSKMIITCECGKTFQRSNLWRHLKTYEHKIRMMFPDGFFIKRKAKLCFIKIRELSNEEITNILRTCVPISIMDYNNFRN